MGAISFSIAYGTTLESVLNLEPSATVYVDDATICQPCVDETGSCWACLTTTQQVFNDGALSSPVIDGYYLLKYSDDRNAIWHIVGGYPQSEGFFN